MPPPKIRAELGHDRVPLFTEEEYTDQLDGDELRDARATRSPQDRLARLEEKHDSLAEKYDTMLQKHEEFRNDIGDRVGKVEVAVADMGGQFKVIPRLVDAMEKATSSLQQRDHFAFTARVDVDKAQAISDIQVEEVVNKSEAEIRKAKWQLMLKIAAIAGGVITLIGALSAAGRC